jgi:hypothetical protein
MSEQVWSIVGYVITSFAGVFFGWLFGRKKNNVEIEGTKVQNFDAAIEAYKKMYEDMIADLKEQNGELKEEVESLKQELSENRKQIITLTNFVLASAIQKDTGVISPESVNNLKKILD